MSVGMNVNIVDVFGVNEPQISTHCDWVIMYLWAKMVLLDWDFFALVII